MEWKKSLRDAFLVCDTNKVGELSDAEVLRALLSLGIVLSHEQQKNVRSMNCEDFIKFGESIVQSNPPDKELQAIISGLSGGRNRIGTVELQQVMSVMKNCDTNDLAALVKILDPTNSGYFDASALLGALAA
ncbi:EF-hand domain pair [Babesia duncani]|uniref:EF-hand domain pair n=1 Tax=Babesia duncani TaxID=323732 RepID=A0AAD9UPW4_9APIC|nr:EF-hand domain pair [Babesia duncani]